MKYDRKYIIRGDADADLRGYELSKLAANIRKEATERKERQEMMKALPLAIILAVLLVVFSIAQAGGF